MESDLTPYNTCSALPARAALVLAPHPDDEVFGCGGAIASHVRLGQPVCVVVLTDGALYGDARARQLESAAAAAVLGCGLPEFWAYPDRGLVYSEALVQRIVDKIAATGSDLVYAPSPWEIHPDHRQTCQLALEAVRRCGPNTRLAFYEVGAPLRPNVLLDLTPLLAVKETAMRCFGSQLEQQDYVQHIQSLNRYRTYTLPHTVTAAEAYWVLTAQELVMSWTHNLLSMVSPGGLAATTQAMAEPTRHPLVSVLVRSRDGRFLSHALDSVGLQTYPNIEVLVAHDGFAALPAKCGPFALRPVACPAPIYGAVAANQLMQAAHGSWLIFLDEDDWLMPEHVSKLAHVLQQQPHTLAAFTGLRITREDGSPTGETCLLALDEASNLAPGCLPLQAVMFSAQLLHEGCKFDEAMGSLAACGFWLAITKKTLAVKVQGFSAAFRNREGRAVLQVALPLHAEHQAELSRTSDAAACLLREAHQQTESLREQMRNADVKIAHLTQLADTKTNAQQALDGDLRSARAREFSQNIEIKKLSGIRTSQLKQLDALDAQMLALHTSRSWRLTRPLRGANRLIAWLKTPAPLRLVRNGLLAVKAEIQRHGVMGFARRLPHFIRHFSRYASVLTSPLPQARAALFNTPPPAVRAVRLHPDLLDDAGTITPIDMGISVVIPTYNAGIEFKWLLRKLMTQRGLKNLEVVVVDSGSKDNTVAWAKEAGCRVVEITQVEFTHSHARNLGAAHATSDYVLFMVQDAYPIGDYWAYGMLRYLLDHADDGLVAASCSEYPRSDSDMMYDAMINIHYRFLGCHERDRIGDFQGSDHMALRSRGQLSDVACLISRKMFGDYGYRGDYAEDLDLGIRLIKDGHKVAMLASVKVVHSHNRPAFYYLKRSYVDVIFLVGMFEDFIFPPVESVPGLLAGIVSTARHVSELLPTLKNALPGTPLTLVLADWIRACRLRCMDLKLSGPSQLGDAGLDNYVDRLGVRLKGLQMDRKADSEAQRFTDTFFARLEHFNTFAADVYGANDPVLLEALAQVVRKTYAAAAGSALGFMFMYMGKNASDESTGEMRVSQPMVNAIDNELRAGV